MLPLEKMTVGALVTGTASELRRAASHLFEPTAEAYAPQLIIPPTVNANVPVVEMHACTVRYGSRTLLESVDWRIMPGERWVLSGPNGSGKSTLLSLICADGPQAYSNDISIFGRRRGTGEVIWEVKRRIGYISPEMQLYFGGVKRYGARCCGTRPQRHRRLLYTSFRRTDRDRRPMDRRSRHDTSVRPHIFLRYPQANSGSRCSPAHLSKRHRLCCSTSRFTVLTHRTKTPCDASLTL